MNSFIKDTVNVGRFTNGMQRDLSILPDKKPKILFSDRKFDVIVPSESVMDVYRPRFICEVNMTIPGYNDIYDNYEIEKNYNSRIRVVWDVARMIEAYKDGYQISLVDYRDAKAIYDIIQEYLTKIKLIYQSHVEENYDIDESELNFIDKFASEIYKNNKQIFTEEVKDLFLPTFAIGKRASAFKTNRLESIEEMKKNGTINRLNNVPNVNTPFQQAGPALGRFGNVNIQNNQNDQNTDNQYKYNFGFKMDIPNIDTVTPREEIFKQIQEIKVRREQKKNINNTFVQNDEFTY